jgi:hypothetical protein
MTHPAERQSQALPPDGFRVLVHELDRYRQPNYDMPVEVAPPESGYRHSRAQTARLRNCHVDDEARISVTPAPGGSQQPSPHVRPRSRPPDDDHLAFGAKVTIGPAWPASARTRRPSAWVPISRPFIPYRF